jgi:Domain of unknown function (DUF397)
MESNPFRTSSYSSANGGQCVEVGKSDAILVRDTTDRDGSTLTLTGGAWERFVARLRG